ncbi:response regulator [Shewanella mesophila]|uniref:response regulator n=1 Tax=Shewanella mesophila TaxID=2864208 RepID=UPI001C65FBBD|nr:response regulator [Shewanella mesophila]QYJ86621.1 response regulator [Shewanella mesophila]
MQYSFDTFVLDINARALYIDEQLVTCDERIVTLLVLLIEAYPDYCKQTYLLNTIWPNTIVSHWSISRLISDTRKLFAKLGLTIPLIQTLHGRGYQLSHEVAINLIKLEKENITTPPQHDNMTEPYKPDRLKNASLKPRTSQHRIYLTLLSLGVFCVALILGFHQAKSQRLKLAEPQKVNARILWVDDHPENNQREQKHLEQHHFGIYNATSTQDAMLLLSLYKYDAIITDMGRDQDPLSGLKFIQLVREQNIDTPIYLYTIVPSESLRKTALTYGAQGIASESNELYQHLLPWF